jgi:hypothetical protein
MIEIVTPEQQTGWLRQQFGQLFETNPTNELML